MQQPNKSSVTEDLSNSTISQERKGLSSLAAGIPDLEERDSEVFCDRHGAVPVKIYKLRGEWMARGCPKCEEDARARASEEEKARNAAALEKSRRTALEERMKGACMPARFADRSFDSFAPENPKAQAVLQTCRVYAERFDAMLKRGTCMVLCGNPGTGKTHLACAIANSVMRETGKSALYITVARAIRMVKETYAKGSDRTEQEAIDCFINPALLILDEAGVQFGTDTEKNILFEIVNSRYEAMLPTILISNLALRELEQYVGARVVDRLRENGGIVQVFDWKSHRGEKPAA